MKAKRTIAGCAMVLFVGCFAVLIVVVRLAGGRPQAYEDLEAQARTAVAQNGGVDVLVKEARTALSIARTRPDDTSAIYNIENGNSCPAILKLQSQLSPYGHCPWIVSKTEELPAHVTIRFGTHARYTYMWIFDPDDLPLQHREGVLVHLGGAVYLARVNE